MFTTPPRSKRFTPFQPNKLSPTSPYPFSIPSTPRRSSKRPKLSPKAAGKTGVKDSRRSQTGWRLMTNELTLEVRVLVLLPSNVCSLICRAAFQDAPPTIEPFEYALFLFGGGSRCQLCEQWRGVITEPVCIVLKHLCRGCLRDRASIEVLSASNIYPGIFDVVPLAIGADDAVIYSVDYFVEADLQLRSGASIQGLRLVYERASAFAASCDQWLKGWNDREALRAIERRREDVSAILHEQGFNLHDFQAVSEHPLVNNKGKLQNQDWADFIFPELVPLITDSRCVRMFQHSVLDSVMTKRVQEFAVFYGRIWGCLDPQDRRAFPDSQTACLIPICRDLLIQPDTVEITLEQFAHIEGDLVHNVLFLVQGLQEALQKCFLAEGVVQVEALVASARSSSLGALSVGSKWARGNTSLEHAVAQFKCGQCQRHCITFREAIVHLNNNSLCKPSRSLDTFDLFSFALSPTTLHILCLSKLPMQATADKLDDLNTSFRCLSCDQLWIGNWRQCIRHSHWYHTNEEPNFGQASRRDISNKYCQYPCETREVVERHTPNITP
ncbi:hypothetical protein AAF712_003954 [Marasmius tenuissimus]|uniref:C2H2-type domain-containing protein n=1 Tax=Marasmius tenuissimus TaxID=585030 RepID=A0ABR3A4Q1_9AGAR